MIPDLDLARVSDWVDARNSGLPDRARGQIEYQIEMSDRSVTVLECRPPWKPEYGPEWTRFPIARFRYTKTRKQWTLYWRDRNLKFHEYDRVDPTPHVEELIEEVESDPTHIFWG